MRSRRPRSHESNPWVSSPGVLDERVDDRIGMRILAISKAEKNEALDPQNEGVWASLPSATHYYTPRRQYFIKNTGLLVCLTQPRARRHAME
jgi:hypothetical protein